MKIRIQDNSIRLRLTRSEVDAVSRDRQVGGATSFPDGARFYYALESSAGSRQPEARFTDGSIVVSVPETTLRQWASSNEVSIEARQSLGDGSELGLLVEKDFACLAPREGEDESDMFPHPMKGRETC